jgi:hypothetical protein
MKWKEEERKRKKANERILDDGPQERKPLGV